MPLKAVRFVRKMRGGAQAHLLDAEDGHSYVVKFRNNPQHRRILVNEWISSIFLRYLQISAPPAAMIEVSADFLAANPEVGLHLGSRQAPVEPGWHFGSRFPGHPERTAVYDFLPDALLGRVVNVGEFLGVYVFDKWMANADARQSIFYRARLEAFGKPESAGFVAQMVDHGYVFDGPHWSFVDSPLQGLYFRPLVYEKVRSLDDFQPWLDRVAHFPEEVIDEAYRELPLAWLNGDRDEAERLLERLQARCKRIGSLVELGRQARVRSFPNWQ
jgi:HipA-like kinase